MRVCEYHVVMGEENHGWRALPAPLLLGLGLTAVQILLQAGFLMRFVDYQGGMELASTGIDLAASALLAYGAAQLAQHHTGARRRGLQIASLAWVIDLTLQLVWLIGFALWRSSLSTRIEHWITVRQYSWFVVLLLPFIGLAIATMRQHRALAVVSVVIAVVSHPPPFARQVIWNWFGLDLQSGELLSSALSLLQLGMIAVLVVKLVPVATTPGPARAAVGLRRAATGLRIWIIAVILGTFPVLFTLDNYYTGSFMRYKLVLVGGTGIHIAAFGWLAFGLLGAVRDGELARGKLAFASATSLWCGMVMSVQLIYFYAALHGYAKVMTLWLPLVAFAGIVSLVTAIGPFVARHRNESLVPDATGRWIIILMGASAAIQGWLLPNADSRASAKLLVIVAALCSVVALAKTARLCSEAATTLDREPGLPAARVISAE